MKVGDLVVLNSGGPKMTVVEVGRENVRCAWMSDSSEIQVVWFPFVCVFRVDGGGEIGVA